MLRPCSSLLSLLPAVMLASCSSIYVPNAPPTVMPRTPGEVHIAGSGGTHGFDGNIGMATDSQTVLVAAGSYMGGGDELVYSRHIYGELMAGWYTSFGVGTLSFYAGAGAGHASASCFGTENLLCDNMARSGLYTRYIVQGNIGARIDSTTIPNTGSGSLGGYALGMLLGYQTEFGLALRGVMVRFDRLEERSYTVDPRTGEAVAGPPSERRATAILFEPTLFSRWVVGVIGFEGQAGVSIPIVNEGEIPVQWVHLSVGVFLRFE